MTGQIKKIAAYAVSIALGLFLLYLALQGVELDALKASIASASFIWIVPIVAAILISHALRAWRWQILLEALPDRQRKRELSSVPFRSAFLSLIIGYFANLLIPRIGEFARSASLSREQGIRFSGVFGTVVVERVVDMAVLVIGIFSLSVLFYDQFLFIQDRIFSPLVSMASQIPIAWTAAGLTGFGALGYVAFRTIKTSQSDKLLQIRRRLVSILNSFRDGMLTLLKAPRRGALVLSTVLMWFTYTLMAYLTFVMLDMHTTFELGWDGAWSIMIFGAIGFAVPAPGGTGSFHYITKLALVNLYFVDETMAVTYAIISHGLHVIVYTVAGVLALFLQGTSLQKLRNANMDKDTTP
ncbi:MAG: lysylphosphatidylglycerol synthase transmembrane domain-containing protein [Bacteroidota bacterium]